MSGNGIQIDWSLQSPEELQTNATNNPGYSIPNGPQALSAEFLQQTGRIPTAEELTKFKQAVEQEGATIILQADGTTLG